MNIVETGRQPAANRYQERRRRAHQPRYRRDSFGELIQIDGAHHRWFEDRGSKCTLLVYIDNATGRLMELCFSDTESTFDYFHSTRRYLEQHGKPVAFYSDQHTVFHVNNVGAPVAKELRLEGIDSMQEANAYLPTFIEQFNTRFAKEPANPTNLHRSLAELDQLNEIMSWQEDRIVSDSLTVQYDRVVYLPGPKGLAKDLQRKRVRVFDYPDGTVAIKYEGTELPYSVFGKARQVKQADIVSNKCLGTVLQLVKERQKVKSIERSKAAPQRRGQKRICRETYRKVNPAALSVERPVGAAESNHSPDMMLVRCY